MAKRLTREQIIAREEALQECMDHLEMDWTDDPEEKKQGYWLLDVLMSMQNKLVDKRRVLLEIKNEASGILSTDGSAG